MALLKQLSTFSALTNYQLPYYLGVYGIIVPLTPESIESGKRMTDEVSKDFSYFPGR